MTLRLIALLWLLLSVARGAADPGEELTSSGGEGAWKPLIATLASKGTVVADFTEKRYFPFHRGPTTLRGVLRIVPGRGLSLQYTEPEPSVLIADADGLLLKDKEGREQGLPSDSRESGAIASLLPIMSFDLPALYPRFVIRAHRTDSGWRFNFTPRDPDVARSLGDIAIGGTATDVNHIEFKHSASTRVEIEVGAARSGGELSPADLKEFFR
jgi:hypothetical protein